MTDRELICNKCGKTAHHRHHIDRNHTNNSPKNIEYLCTLCHAKEHNTEPNFTELKKLITYYERVQKLRVAVHLFIKSFNRIELLPPEELFQELKNLKSIERKYEKQINLYWENNSNSLYVWATNIEGIGCIMASKILSQINFDDTPSFSALWSYAGLAPNQHMSKGKKSNWNHTLKYYCYQLVNCFIKKNTPKYRGIYDCEKEKQLNNDVKRMHAHNRAIRKTAKIFLRNLYLERERPSVVCLLRPSEPCRPLPPLSSKR